MLSEVELGVAYFVFKSCCRLPNFVPFEWRQCRLRALPGRKFIQVLSHYFIMLLQLLHFSFILISIQSKVGKGHYSQSILAFFTMIASAAAIVGKLTLWISPFEFSTLLNQTLSIQQKGRGKLFFKVFV